MINKEEKIKTKRSKFEKANKNGQIPKDCIHFNWCGKHCWNGTGNYEDTATDCIVLKGEYCSNYCKGINE